MSFTFTCDSCSEVIDSEQPYATVWVEYRDQDGVKKKRRWQGDYVGHYHCEPCWRAVHDAVTDLHESVMTPEQQLVRSLEQIPTESPGATSHRLDEAWKRGAAGPDGVFGLDLPSTLKRQLRYQRPPVITIADLERRLEAGEKFWGLGPKRTNDIRDAVRRYRAQEVS
jgi:hypothetical protein